MAYFGKFYLDKEKDVIVSLFLRVGEMSYRIETPNHGTGNLISNLAKLCNVDITFAKNGLKIMEGPVPCYRDGENRKVWIMRLADTKVANIYPDGSIERKAYIPAIAKTLMSQTKDYKLDIRKTLVKTYILNDCKFHTDLHTHMNANLSPDVLIALGIVHQIRYPYYYVKKLGLDLTDEQKESLEIQRKAVAKVFQDPAKSKGLTGKYLERRINDNTFINFADLILNNIPDAASNIPKIRASLAVMKDGQAVFTNLEKVYLYRYVFTKGQSSDEILPLRNIGEIPDMDIVKAANQMLEDRRNPNYRNNTLYQDTLLWIARMYAANGVCYAELADTTLVKPEAAPALLSQIHSIMPHIIKETGVSLRFLAAFRRTPLTIVKDDIAPLNYFVTNLQALHAVFVDPYVAGSDFVGEEMNDIRELEPVIREIVKVAAEDPSFVIRIHAGENDSLPDNVSNAVKSVLNALAPGQAFPYMRIGHGLYTPNLKTQEGKNLLSMLRDNHVVLEFQITSNVRLNNLSTLENHPLKKYLEEGILCVQGTDGGALYGTDSIDEQLSLEKLLDLSPDEMRKMRQAEDIILEKVDHDVMQKSRLFAGNMNISRAEDPIAEYFTERMQKEEGKYTNVFVGGRKYDSASCLADQVQELPLQERPIILAGGSFNNDKHTTSLHTATKKFIDKLLNTAHPKAHFFVIGDTLSGYEKYLLEENAKRKDPFQIFAFVPAAVEEASYKKLKASGVAIRISIEPNAMGVYKSIAFEIFRRRESTILALDGNSAAANLIQDAKNSKHKCKIFISKHSKSLMTKAASLEGYINILEDDTPVQDVLS